MRLLHTRNLEFEEYFEDQIPEYAILSHRWGPIHQEVSYSDFISKNKRSSSGHQKILKFCEAASRRGYEYCWIDTCCINKNSSAELSEAINSMFNWYQKAAICCAYLSDVSTGTDISHSEWFTRGWTLQELIAPWSVQFFDREWGYLGSKADLQLEISRASGVDGNILAGVSEPEEYSIAQIMSWAANRKTSRQEDEAYCLLGLFRVNMPLLYGEGFNAFRRLQEEILAKGEDNSLFAWNPNPAADRLLTGSPSILAPSPNAFTGCGNIVKGFASQRILFEKSSRGMMVLIHRSYDPGTLETLLGWLVEAAATDFNAALGLTIPLGCGRQHFGFGYPPRQATEQLSLQLALDRGKWRRVGIFAARNEPSVVDYQGNHYFAYTNDYVRIYIHHDQIREQDRARAFAKIPLPRIGPSTDIRYLTLRDTYTI